MTKKEEEKSLAESILTLTKLVKKLRSERYLQMVDNPKKFFFYNFLLSIVKGVGFALGASLIFAFLIWLLSQVLSQLSIVPVLGDWIVDLLDYVQRTKGY